MVEMSFSENSTVHTIERLLDSPSPADGCNSSTITRLNNSAYGFHNLNEQTVFSDRMSRRFTQTDFTNGLSRWFSADGFQQTDVTVQRFNDYTVQRFNNYLPTVGELGQSPRFNDSTFPADGCNSSTIQRLHDPTFPTDGCNSSTITRLNDSANGFHNLNEQTVYADGFHRWFSADGCNDYLPAVGELGQSPRFNSSTIPTVQRFNLSCRRM